MKPMINIKYSSGHSTSFCLCPVGSKAVVSADDVNSLAVHTFPVCPAHLRVLQLAEELKFALEGQICAEDKETLLRQMPSATAHSLLLWIDRRSEISVNVQGSGNGESYQERLSRLEEDKESLVLQVSVLTDQVKAQGEKIRDLENSLGEYQHKLKSTEEMLQQELLKRSSLESQKLGLMDEVSCLKLKLENMEEKHIKSWTTEQVCGWLEDIGLGQYVSLARQWVNSGQTLLSATPQELEKEICIKHPLHRKKLQLSLRAFSYKTMEKSSELDHIWVTRWLDDVGLPQYKDQFYESKVDGRMLQYLTVNDLLFLKVTSQLHHLSIKCAIHVLHVNKFNPNCLRRRPGDENKTSPSEVVQWSNHRVMEWLRSVDLAEYAPNLRGSGVHGGLIILEPRFQSETLAMLLNIPPQKTLLRRHLTTNFNSLVGPQAQQEKQEFANASGHAPLTTTAKVRPTKLGFTNFRQLRKLKVDESADYICPMDTGTPPALSGTPKRTYGSFRGISPNLARDSDRLEKVGSKK
uniref:PPFIA binding protein 2 n=1 Tax=Sinocyclocheilus grahami TaxID=75366 RepID=A0A672PQ13_SINGR